MQQTCSSHTQGDRVFTNPDSRAQTLSNPGYHLQYGVLSLLFSPSQIVTLHLNPAVLHTIWFLRESLQGTFLAVDEVRVKFRDSLDIIQKIYLDLSRLIFTLSPINHTVFICTTYLSNLRTLRQQLHRNTERDEERERKSHLIAENFCILHRHLRLRVAKVQCSAYQIHKVCQFTCTLEYGPRI